MVCWRARPSTLGKKSRINSSTRNCHSWGRGLRIFFALWSLFLFPRRNRQHHASHSVADHRPIVITPLQVRLWESHFLPLGYTNNTGHPPVNLVLEPEPEDDSSPKICATAGLTCPQLRHSVLSSSCSFPHRHSHALDIEWLGGSFALDVVNVNERWRRRSRVRRPGLPPVRGCSPGRPRSRSTHGRAL